MPWIRGHCQQLAPGPWDLCSWFTTVLTTPPALPLALFSHLQCLPGPCRHLRLWDWLAHSGSHQIPEGWPLSSSMYRCRNKVKETATCPRSHNQQVSEPRFEHKPSYAQSQPSLLLSLLPGSQAKGKSARDKKAKSMSISHTGEGMWKDRVLTAALKSLMSWPF